MKANSAGKIRKALLTIFGHLYEQDFDFNPIECAYCGDVRECLDHRPPISVVGDMSKSERDEFRKRGGKFVLYPCCHECNLRLSSKKYGSRSEALIFLEKSYERELSKRKFGWTQEELNELGPGLKREISAYAAKRNEFVKKFQGVQFSIASLEEVE